VSEFLLTPSARLSHEIEVKKSRFLTLVARVSTPAEAREVVNERKAAMPDARHHCAAFVVSADGAQPFSHSSDDGEPSGTAGRPMLDVLAGSKLVDVVAVVTRYFGGTLLGTGGLVRAYSDSVRECLEGAPVVVRDECLRDGHTEEILDRLQSCVAEHFPVKIQHATLQLEPVSHLEHEAAYC